MPAQCTAAWLLPELASSTASFPWTFGRGSEGEPSTPAGALGWAVASTRTTPRAESAHMAGDDECELALDVRQGNEVREAMARACRKSACTRARAVRQGRARRGLQQPHRSGCPVSSVSCCSPQAWRLGLVVHRHAPLFIRIETSRSRARGVAGAPQGEGRPPRRVCSRGKLKSRGLRRFRACLSAALRRIMAPSAVNRSASGQGCELGLDPPAPVRRQ